MYSKDDNFQTSSEDPTSYALKSDFSSNYFKMLSNRTFVKKRTKLVDRLTNPQKFDQSALYLLNLSDLWNHLPIKLKEVSSCFSQEDFKIIKKSSFLAETMLWRRAEEFLPTMNSKQELKLLRVKELIKQREKSFKEEKKVEFIQASGLMEEVGKYQKEKSYHLRNKLNFTLNFLCIKEEKLFCWYLFRMLEHIKTKISKISQQKTLQQINLLIAYLFLGLRWKTWQQLIFSQMLISSLRFKKIVKKNGSSLLLKYFLDAPVEQLHIEFEKVNSFL